MKVGWDVSHMEFTIADHYYFSKLSKLLAKEGIDVVILKSLDDLEDFDVIVLNYPEKKFRKEEKDKLIKFVENGGRLIALGYYKDEDGVSSVLNDIARDFGMEILNDVVLDEENNINGDPYFPITSKVSSMLSGVKKVVLPCSAPISIDNDKVEILIMGEKTSRSESNTSTILAGLSNRGKGEFVLIGTCVFWDNYSIDLYDNSKLAIWLLKYRKRS